METLVMKILKFYADWCSPCKALSAVIGKVDHNVPMVEINVDTDRETAAFYGIRTIPTMLLIDENENIVNRKGGTMTEEQFREFLKG